MKHINDKTNFLGFSLNLISKEELLKQLDLVILTKKRASIYGLCSGTLARVSNKKRELPTMLKVFNYLVADGSAIPIIGKICGIPSPEVIPIVDLSYSLLELADKNGYSVMLLGASRESNILATTKLRELYPNARIEEGIDGYFEHGDIDEVVKQINGKDVDILLIGMTYPYKEKFVYFYQEDLTSRVLLPCGGAIDVFSGMTKRPPKLLKKIPITWLIRWIQEPTRLSIAPDLRFLFITLPIVLVKHLFSPHTSISLINFHGISDNMQVQNIFKTSR